jgi:hypothetical protein
MDRILLIAAVICFFLDAFGVGGRVKWFSLGVALYALTLVL